MQIIAITGGSGFIGQALIRQHLLEGDQVRVLTRRVKKSTAMVTYYQGDLTAETVSLSNFVDGVDVLYHCAGELTDEIEMRRLHVDGTRRLLDASIGRIGRWVQLSSVGVYGPRRDGVVTERSDYLPKGVYETTKYESDLLVETWADENDAQTFSIIRPSIVFGVGMPNQSLRQLLFVLEKNLFIYMGNREAVVNYTPIESVISAMMLAGQSSRAIDQSFIVSEHMTVQAMIEHLCLGLQVDIPRWSVPEIIIRLLAKLLVPIKRFPLTSSRVDALTGHAVYQKDKLVQTLGFIPPITLGAAFETFAARFKGKV